MVCAMGTVWNKYAVFYTNIIYYRCMFLYYLCEILFSVASFFHCRESSDKRVYSRCFNGIPWVNATVINHGQTADIKKTHDVCDDGLMWPRQLYSVRNLGPNEMILRNAMFMSLFIASIYASLFSKFRKPDSNICRSVSQLLYHSTLVRCQIQFVKFNIIHYFPFM